MGFWNWLVKLFEKGDKSPRPRKEKPLISLVLLLRQERFLDDSILRNLVNKAWDANLEPGDDSATDFVVGFSPAFIIQYQGRNFLVNNFSQPYVQDVEAAARDIKELRRRQAFEQHRAWLSVDLLGKTNTPEELSQAYRMIGKLTAALADQDCLALFSPETDQLIPYDAELDEKLRGPNVVEDVFSSWGKVPVLQVGGDDPRMVAAQEEARQRWPEFVAAFNNRRSDQKFAVKAPFDDGVNTEFMWITVTALDGNTISGRIDNEPVNVRTVRLGSRVRISAERINDWLYTVKDSMEGGFTIKAIQEIQRGGN